MFVSNSGGCGERFEDSGILLAFSAKKDEATNLKYCV